MPQGSNFNLVYDDGIYLTLSPNVYTVPEKFGDNTTFDVSSLFPNVITATITVVSGGVVTETRQATSFTFSKSTFTVYDAVASNRYRVTVTSEGAVAYLDINIELKQPQSIEMTVVDTETYPYGGTGQYWNFDPSTLSVSKVKIKYNDGTEETNNDPQWGGIVYKAETGNAQYVSGNNQIEKDLHFSVWLQYTFRSSVQADPKYYSLRYEHALTVVPVQVDHYAFTAQPSYVQLGFKIEQYKSQFTLVAVDGDDNEYELRPEQYSFANTNYILNVNSITLLTVTINGSNYTISLDSAIPVYPAIIDYVEQFWSGGSAKTSYELYDSFNFSTSYFVFHFYGTDYTVTSTFYNSGANKFTISFGSYTTSTCFDGSATLETLGIDSSNSGTTMTFTVSSGISDSAVFNKTITIFDIDNIVSIEIENPYRDYHVGENFLKLEDTTNVIIYYRNSNDELVSKRVPLNSGYNKLLVEPAKDELLNQKNANKTIRVSSAFDSAVNAQYWITVGAKEVNNNLTTKHCRVEYFNAFSLPDGTIIEPENGLLIIFDEEGEEIGYIEDINDETKNAKVVLFNDYVPEIEGSSNITILYPFYEANLAKEINECHFGVLFGSNNARNRLFLSGNPDIYNADWHSSEPNYNDYDDTVILANGNFSYFSDESIMYYGETDNKVIGYEVVSNDKLLVLKDKSDKEKTVYFRNPTVVTAIDASGTAVKGYDNETLYQEEFSLTKGNNSVAGISPKTIVNFNGETLFIDSNNELVGLDVAGIIGDNQRYANTRSLYIDRMLNNLDLSESILWTNNNYLFIAVKNYGVFATNYRTYDSETKQYEWFFLTSDNPTSFLEVGDTLYFANEKGELYKYSKDTYKDIKKVFSSNTLQYYNGQLIVDQKVIDAIKAEPEEDFTFKTLIDKNASYQEKVFYSIATMSSNAESNPDIFIDNTNHRLEIKRTSLEIIDGFIYYLDGLETINVNASQEDLQNVAGAKFRLRQISTDGELGVGDCFHLYKIVGDEEVEIEITSFSSARLFGCLEDEEAEVLAYHEKDEEEDDDYNSITLGRNGNALNLYTYSSQPAVRTFRSEIRKCKNVEAFYMTAPFVMGGLDHFKTIWSFTVTNDFAIPSQIEVAYASNKIPLVDMKKMSYISLSREQIGFDFSTLNFHKVDFDKDVVPRTYTFNRILSLQKFICFVFRNYDDSNAVLSAMSVSYSTSYPSYSGD